MKNRVLIVSGLALTFGVAASPPPPPPPAPGIAQGEFDGFQGPDLWRAYQRTMREAALESADILFEMAVEPGEGYYVASRKGPSINVSTGYWNEGYRADFFEICSRSGMNSCAWHYRVVRIAGSIAEFNALIAENFAPALIASTLNEIGVSPSDFDPDRTRIPISIHTRGAVTDLAGITHVSEASCPAVGQWRERLEEVAPIYLSGEAPRQPGADSTTPPPMPPPPYPIHIRHVIEIPVTAFGTADVSIRIDDTRNRQLSDFWSLITRGISDCSGAE